jgi:hypothetical protein
VRPNIRLCARSRHCRCVEAGNWSAATRSAGNVFPRGGGVGRTALVLSRPCSRSGENCGHDHQPLRGGRFCPGGVVRVRPVGKPPNTSSITHVPPPCPPFVSDRWVGVRGRGWARQRRTAARRMPAMATTLRAARTMAQTSTARKSPTRTEAMPTAMTGMVSPT